MVWRLPELKSKGQIEAVASREAMFVANNWALLGGMTFILVSTMYPKISELWGEPAQRSTMRKPGPRKESTSQPPGRG